MHPPQDHARMKMKGRGSRWKAWAHFSPPPLHSLACQAQGIASLRPRRTVVKRNGNATHYSYIPGGLLGIRRRRAIGKIHARQLAKLAIVIFQAIPKTHPPLIALRLMTSELIVCRFGD